MPLPDIPALIDGMQQRFLQTRTGNVQEAALVDPTTGGTYAALPAPIAVDTRRRVQILKLLELSAAAIPTSTPGTLSSVVDLSPFNEMLLWVFGLSLAGTATGLTVALQKVEPQNGNWFDWPQAVLNVTPTAGSALQANLGLTNFGGLVRARINCSANSFTGGFVQLFAEMKR